MTKQVKEALADLPKLPGVYIMRDQAGRIIYVGKAVNLRRRVKSYFKNSAKIAVKVQRLVAKVAELETIVTDSEMEALTLECNLIKQHLPRYNILLKDDKSYPYLKVTLKDEFPCVCVTRRVVQDGGRYFGPYTDSSAMHETLELLKTLFPLRTCKQLTRQARPCLQYHIKRCAAPCANLISVPEYGKMIKAVCMLLDGRIEDLTRDLKKNMQQAVVEQNFEQAAKIRDQLKALNKIFQPQKAITSIHNELDVVGVAQDGGRCCIQIFFVRQGKLLGREHYFVSSEGDEGLSEILTAFIKQYYGARESGAGLATMPKQILLEELPPKEERELIAGWLQQKAEHAVEMVVPRRGVKRELLQLANQNAKKLLDEQLRKGGSLIVSADYALGAAEELAKALGMDKTVIDRMDCFDISHTQGTETVASMVVFRGGRASKKDYRHYKIRSTEGAPDDFQAMREVVYRRYRKKEDLPDLIVIDGGKGQLASALEVLQELGLERLQVVGLAKREEEIFKPSESEGILLQKDSRALHLIQQIRDEAHRFAITYHRKLRTKRNLTSILDQIPGVGPKRKAALYQRFKTISAMRAANVSELSQVEGISKALAENIYKTLNVDRWQI